MPAPKTPTPKKAAKNNDVAATPEQRRQNSLKNLRMWKPGQSGNPKGRAPRLVSGVINEMREAGYNRVARADVEELYEYLLNVNIEELIAIANDPSLPAFVTIAAERMLMPKGGLEAVETILNRAHGQSAQRVETDLTLNHDVKDANALADLLKQSGLIPAPAGNNPNEG